MDMKKILQAFDSSAATPVQGTYDMKKFVSIIRENANPYTPVEETVITGFEEGSVGGDANSFLIAADKINDLVMGEIDKIKINADEQLLKGMMSKFNEFMSAYHAVGKDILQPDLFNDSLGEQGVAEGEKTMSRAAKGNEKYGKDGMKALAKAGREGASEEKLDKIRDKHDKYDEGLSFTDYVNLAEAKQKGVDGKACWDGYKRMGTKKKGGKTVDNCVPTGKK